MAESRSDLRETLRARARTLVQQESDGGGGAGGPERAPLPSALSSEREPLERADSFSAQLASFRSGAKTSATSRLRRASIDITTQAKARAQEAVRAELSRGSPGAVRVAAAALSSPKGGRSMDDALAEFRKTAEERKVKRANAGCVRQPCAWLSGA